MSRIAKSAIPWVVVAWLFLPAGYGCAVWAQEEETPGSQRVEPSSQADAEAVPPGEAAPSEPEEPVSELAEPRTDLLRALRGDFPEGLPFFGFQLMGLAERQLAEWKNLPIAPFYELGPGDEVVVTVWGSFDLNLRLVVNEQGYVVLPGDDRVYVNGLKFGQLKELLLGKLRQTYSEALSSEKLTSGAVSYEATLGKVRGIQVMITGQVAHPGGYTFARPLVLLMDALARSGGITAKGSLRSLVIRRGDERILIDLYDLLTQGEVEVERLLLRAGDVVSVPYRARTVSIEGKIGNPGIYELKAGQHLEDLIEMAGGLVADADRERVQIRRIDPDRGRVLRDVNLIEALAAVELQDQDQIALRALPRGLRGSVVRVEGEGVVRPGTYELTEENEGIGDFLSRAGLYEDAVRDRITLVRIGPNFVKQKFILDLAEAVAQGFKLQDEDHLFVNSAYQLTGGDKQITISGHAKKTGLYLLPKDLTLYDVLLLYGGLTDPDFRAQAYLIRGDIIRIDKETGKSMYVPFNVEAILRGEEDLPLESNDEVVVYSVDRFRQKLHVTIEGEVRYPGQYELKQNMGLADLLTQAGKTTEDAHTLEAEVTRLVPGREPPSESFIIVLQQGQEYLLQHQDMVFIRRIPFWAKPKIVRVGGEVKFAGRYVLTQYNEPLSWLIERAGGLSQEAFLEGARFTRSWNGEQRQVALDLEKALSGDPEHDIILQAEDEIYIPPQNHAIEVKGAVQLPRLVQYLPGKKAGYYVEVVGGYAGQADSRKAYVIRANSLVRKASRRFWVDPEVPPGCVLVVPEKKPGKLLWERPWAMGFFGGALVGSLVWYGTK